MSDGQFVNVLTRELNLLDHGFKQMDPTYNPQLVIIVGQCLGFPVGSCGWLMVYGEWLYCFMVANA